jgi:hypothetical protein
MIDGCERCLGHHAAGGQRQRDRLGVERLRTIQDGRQGVLERKQLGHSVARV